MAHEESILKYNINEEFGLSPVLTLFNNPRGVAWFGKVQRSEQPGTIVLLGPRRVECGLVNGAADEIGYLSYVIKPEDVGKTVAIWVSVETKSQWGNLTKAQRIHLRNVNRAGGIAGCVKSVAEVHAMVDFTVLPESHFLNK